MRDAILQLSVDASPERLAESLPDRWTLTHPEHMLSHRLEESRQKSRRRDQRRADRRRSSEARRGDVARESARPHGSARPREPW